MSSLTITPYLAIVPRPFGGGIGQCNRSPKLDARASGVRVTAEFTLNDVALRVQDDDAGFRVPERAGELVSAGHYGLMGMHERAQLIGARLAIRSGPGEGTTVEVRLPLSPS